MIERYNPFRSFIVTHPLPLPQKGGVPSVDTPFAI